MLRRFCVTLLVTCFLLNGMAFAVLTIPMSPADETQEINLIKKFYKSQVEKLSEKVQSAKENNETCQQEWLDDIVYCQNILKEKKKEPKDHPLNSPYIQLANMRQFDFVGKLIKVSSIVGGIDGAVHFADGTAQFLGLTKDKSQEIWLTAAHCIDNGKKITERKRYISHVFKGKHFLLPILDISWHDQYGGSDEVSNKFVGDVALVLVTHAKGREDINGPNISHILDKNQTKSSQIKNRISKEGSLEAIAMGYGCNGVFHQGLAEYMSETTPGKLDTYIGKGYHFEGLNFNNLKSACCVSISLKQEESDYSEEKDSSLLMSIAKLSITKDAQVSYKEQFPLSGMIGHGDSGGPLMLDGNLVGINTGMHLNNIQVNQDNITTLDLKSFYTSLLHPFICDWFRKEYGRMFEGESKFFSTTQEKKPFLVEPTLLKQDDQLLKESESLKESNTETETMFQAINNGDKNMVEILVQKNKKLINEKNEKIGFLTPFHFAIINHNTEISKILLDNGAEVDSPINDELETPLHYAAENGLDELCCLLIKFYASLDKRDKSGRTPLDVAGNENIKKFSKMPLPIRSFVKKYF